MFFHAFSFADFEISRGSTGKTAQKRLLPNFLKIKLKKRGETLFRECMYIENLKKTSIQCEK